MESCNGSIYLRISKTVLEIGPPLFLLSNERKWKRKDDTRWFYPLLGEVGMLKSCDLSLDILSSFASFVFTIFDIREMKYLFSLHTRWTPSFLIVASLLCSAKVPPLSSAANCSLNSLGCSLPSATDSLSLFPILSLTRGTPIRYKL